MSEDASPARDVLTGRAEAAAAPSGRTTTGSAPAAAAASESGAPARPQRRCLNLAAHKLDVQLPPDRHGPR
jgi:hypothetical protein